MLTIQFDNLDLKPGHLVLDVGCGGGRHIRQTRLTAGVDAIGVDIGADEARATATALREVDALAPELGGADGDAGRWLSTRGSVYELPFADATFDCVIISEELEHLHDDRGALREISRVLKPGGILAASVPREGPESVCWALSKRYRNTPGGHVRIYRRRRLRKMLNEEGYRVFGSHFAHGLHSPYWWLKCLVGPEREDVSIVNLYHKLLVWDIMRRPLLTRLLERMLVPFIGKSVVFYGVKV